MSKTKQKIFLLFLGLIGFILPLFASADTLGQKVTFFIDASYDLENREQISATLREISSQLYFYIDDSWWAKLNNPQRLEVNQALINLGQEFEDKIYPTLTQTFGSEWKPGIDNDERITILIHPMIEEAGGAAILIPATAIPKPKLQTQMREK
jgi:hypothetical protein